MSSSVANPRRRCARNQARLPVSRLALTLALAQLVACQSPEDHRREADEEAYALIEERGAELLSGAAEFTIEPNPDSLRQRILAGTVTTLEPLSLHDCLVFAAENNRAFQTRREQLYLAALDVTLERWRLSWQQTGDVLADVNGVGEEAGTGGSDLGGSLAKVFGTGARVLSNLGLSIARNLGTSDDWTVFSDIGFDLTLPLLRGSGRRIITEPLTQAERDLLYEVRAFEAFRRTLAVDVAGRVYRLLQLRDAVNNEIANVESLALLREKNEAMAEAGRLSEIQVDQTRQNELSSRDRLLAARRRVADEYDDFKFFLGLPVEFELDLDPSLLGTLAARDIDVRLPDEETVLRTALDSRLDLATARDRTTDAARRIFVSADALRAGLDLAARVDLRSEIDKPLEFDFDNATWNLSALLNLPVNLLPQRNTYRASLISAQVAARRLEELTDSIIADLRASLRILEATRLSYGIQQNAVTLAERRVESARLSLDAGRVETRDLLEAQDALLQAQNGATRALIDYVLSELDLYRDMEALRFENGKIAFVALATAERG